MTDPEACNGVHEPWKFSTTPKRRAITHETGQNRAKLRVLMTNPEACTRVHDSWKLPQDPKTLAITHETG